MLLMDDILIYWFDSNPSYVMRVIYAATLLSIVYVCLFFFVIRPRLAHPVGTNFRKTRYDYMSLYDLLNACDESMQFFEDNHINSIPIIHKSLVKQYRSQGFDLMESDPKQSKKCLIKALRILDASEPKPSGGPTSISFGVF